MTIVNFIYGCTNDNYQPGFYVELITQASNKTVKTTIDNQFTYLQYEMNIFNTLNYECMDFAYPFL
jgi:hypothetical protein